MVMVALLAGCSSVAPTSGPTGTPSTTLVALKTQAPGLVCMEAITAGVLVADPTSSVALRSSSGVPTQMIWPAGWSDRLDAGAIAVVDDHGALVARVGDTVSMGGGGPDPWAVCPPVTIVGSSPTAS